MKSLLQQLKKLEKRKKTFREFSAFLKNGIYSGDSRAKVFWLKKNPQNQSFCFEHLKRRLPASLVKKILFQRTMNTKNKLYDGEIIVFGNTTSDDIPASVKIFHLKRQEVVTIYNDHTKMQNDLQAYEYFQDKLPLVPMLLQEPDQKFIKEKLISSRSIDQLNEQEYASLFEKVVNCYVQYFQREAIGETTTIAALLNEGIGKGIEDAIPYRVVLELQNVKQKEVQLKILHGDFTYSNLLVDQEACYFIDFEHFGKYCFYYDIFI